MIKKKCELVWHVARMEKLEMCAKVWFESPKGGDHLRDIDVDDSIIDN
jgi:hypothetical protein